MLFLQSIKADLTLVPCLSNDSKGWKALSNFLIADRMSTTISALSTINGYRINYRPSAYSQHIFKRYSNRWHQSQVGRAQHRLFVGALASSSDRDELKENIKIDLNLPRRSMLVTFTCDRCGTRTERLVNPVAWKQGMVICQCMGCQIWHKLQDAGNLVEEIRYGEMDNSDDE